MSRGSSAHPATAAKIIASFEFFERSAIFDGDRDYSAVQVNGTSFGDTVGISVGGNTGFPGNFSSRLSDRGL